MIFETSVSSTATKPFPAQILADAFPSSGHYLFVEAASTSANDEEPSTGTITWSNPLFDDPDESALILDVWQHPSAHDENDELPTDWISTTHALQEHQLWQRPSTDNSNEEELLHPATNGIAWSNPLFDAPENGDLPAHQAINSNNSNDDDNNLPLGWISVEQALITLQSPSEESSMSPAPSSCASIATSFNPSLSPAPSSISLCSSPPYSIAPGSMASSPCSETIDNTDCTSIVKATSKTPTPPAGCTEMVSAPLNACPARPGLC
jgi:hypothetical protein